MAWEEQFPRGGLSGHAACYVLCMCRPAMEGEEEEEEVFITSGNWKTGVCHRAAYICCIHR